MKKILIVASLILASANVTTAEAAIPVRKNLVENVESAAQLNSQETFSVDVTSEEVSLDESAAPAPGGSKSHIAAMLLTFFFGYIGVHRFYLGYTWQGIVQILTLGGFFGLWVMIDFIRIIIKDLKPKNGSYSM